MVTTCWVPTPTVFTGNTAVNCPEGIITVNGTLTSALLLAKEMIAPPGPAGPFNVTAPFDALPPITVDGLTSTDNNVAGVIVRAAVWAIPLRFAFIAALTWEPTPDV